MILPTRYLVRVSGVLIGLMLVACTPSPPIKPVTPTASATLPSTPIPSPTFSGTPIPAPSPTPDPFCQNDFVVADGQGGLMCQQTRVAYKFIGINVRELAYVGDQNQSLTKVDVYRVDLTSANPGIIQHQLEQASQMGVKVVRIFAPRFYDANTDIHTLSDVITAVDKVLAISSLLEQQRRIEPLKYLITFTDFYAAAPGFNVYNLHCPGYSDRDFSDPFCYIMNGEPPHLRAEWFKADYARPTFGEGSYKQYVETLIKHYNAVVTISVNDGDPKGIRVIGASLKSIQIRPTQIFAWELGNELKVDDPSHALAYMQSFVRDMACSIHGWDQYPRMVSSGFASTFHATNAQRHDPAELYDLQCEDQRAAFDLGTIHGYNNQWSIPRSVVLPDNDRNFSDRLEQYTDYRWLQAHKLPYIVEELGFTGGNHSRVGEKCVDGSYAIGDDVWSGDATHGDGSGRDTLLPQTSITRGPAVTAALDRFFALDASGVMPWAFQAGSLDLMMHDACRGMDPIYHTDWKDLFIAYCHAASRLDSLALACIPVVD